MAAAATAPAAATATDPGTRALIEVLAISGSLGDHSSNSRLVRTAARAATTLHVTCWDGLGMLPHFRPDVSGDEHVASLRRAVAAADVVLFATPEYAGGMPGALKNALDWLVGSGELYGKPVVVVSVAPSPIRGRNARRWVAEVVRMQGGAVLDSFTVAVGTGDDERSIAEKAQHTLLRVRRALERGTRD